ncbi:hypothetical protein ACH36K_16085 [Clostridium sp. MB05]|jgi:hypothetical protein
MAAYLALQISKRKLDYIAVVNKFSKYKDDIDSILESEGKEALIQVEAK